MTRTLDVLFRVIGAEVPADHGYALFGAISRILEREGDGWMHGNTSVGLHTIRGSPGVPGRYLLGERARFGLRLPAELVPRVLMLAGKSIELDGCRLRIGVPQTRALLPATTLHCRIATTRNGHAPARFDAEIARQAAALDLHGRILRVPLRAPDGAARDPSRRVVRIRDKRVIGYALLATELTAHESIRLQEHGLGGRRRMGCGVFVPFRPRLWRPRTDAHGRDDR
ncbi:MAG: type I-MYXAN CRISPR-associated protein Cas6/Cmx6 [Spirochaetaceae bacterium]|nr:type I-MYXAN CRISPR-associated protein Cas6/Cmx6 [Spirochaetaceae bacterium]